MGGYANTTGTHSRVTKRTSEDIELAYRVRRGCALGLDMVSEREEVYIPPGSRSCGLKGALLVAPVVCGFAERAFLLAVRRAWITRITRVARAQATYSLQSRASAGIMTGKLGATTLLRTVMIARKRRFSDR